jgi:hypothetical protein
VALAGMPDATVCPPIRRDCWSSARRREMTVATCGKYVLVALRVSGFEVAEVCADGG